MRRILGAGLLVLISAMAEAGPVVLTADQMRAFGTEALTKGYADQALEIKTELVAALKPPLRLVQWLDTLDEPHPVLEWGLRWCERRAPAGRRLPPRCS